MRFDPFWATIGLIFGVLVITYAFYAKSIGKIMGKYQFIYAEKQPGIFKAYFYLALVMGFGSIGFIVYAYLYCR